MKVFVPGLDESLQVKLFEIQCQEITWSTTDIITGNINNEVYDSCFVALTVARTMNFISDELKYHIHFTNPEFLKTGSSVGLGVFLKLFLISYSYPFDLIATGELDLLGNVLKIGGYDEKKKILNSDYANSKFFICPKDNMKDGKRESNEDMILTISNVLESKELINEIIRINLC